MLIYISNWTFFVNRKMWLGFCISLFQFLIMLKLYEGSIHVHTFGSIPLLPEFRSVCSIENAVDVRFHVSITECRNWCERTSVCSMIHYNPYSTICVLKDAGTPTPAPGGRCVSMAVSIDTAGTDSDVCATRPCGITSLCVPSEISSNGFGYVCMPIYCPVPTTIQNAASLSNILRKSGESDVYHCKPRYSGFHDRPNINCTGNGTLTETGYTCYTDCPSVPILTTADVKISPRTPYINNTVIHYECKPGFYNITPAVSTCDDKGRWSHFTCYPYCPRPGNPANGYITTTFPVSQLTVDTIAKFNCNPGGYLYPFDDPGEVTCQLTGRWTYSTPCYRYCGDPPAGSWSATGTSLDYASPGPPYTVKSFAKYSCTPLTTLNGDMNDKKRCNSEGNWEGLVICCAPMFNYNPDTERCSLRK